MVDHVLLHPKNHGYKGPEPFLGFSDESVSLSAVNERISNNLALLASTVSMRGASFTQRKGPIDAHEVAAALHEITARIAILGHFHRLLSTQPGSTHAEFGSHLRELCRLLIATLAVPGQMELVETGIDDCPVGADRFLPLSVIVTEVVTNAIKYAHPAGVPGKLAIGCRRENDDTVVVVVEDDGVGFPEGFDFAAHRGIGTRTIHVLAEQIDAEIAFDSRPTGLRFELRLPTDAD